MNKSDEVREIIRSNPEVKNALSDIEKEIVEAIIEDGEDNEEA